MRSWITAVAVLTAASLAGQNLDAEFKALAEKAKSNVELNLDGDQIAQFTSKAPQLAGVKSVSIHTYEYAKPGDYPAELLEPVRKRFASDAGWSRFLRVREKDEAVDIFVQQQAGRLIGFVLISAGPKEVAIIQALGAIELASIQEVVKSAIQYDLASVGAVKP